MPQLTVGPFTKKDKALVQALQRELAVPVPVPGQARTVLGKEIANGGAGKKGARKEAAIAQLEPVFQEYVVTLTNAQRAGELIRLASCCVATRSTRRQ